MSCVVGEHCLKLQVLVALRSSTTGGLLALGRGAALSSLAFKALEVLW